MSRDIGDTCVIESLETPATGRGLVVGFASSAGQARSTPDQVRSADVLAWAHGIGKSGRTPSSTTVVALDRPAGARAAFLDQERVDRLGTVRNGFFDNLVVNRASGHQTWQGDPETLPGLPDQPIDLTAGNLNGSVDVTRRYKHSTVGWPPGWHSVYVRLYSHLEPGAPGRQMIAENLHALEVYEG